MVMADSVRKIRRFLIWSIAALAVTAVLGLVVVAGMARYAFQQPFSATLEREAGKRPPDGALARYRPALFGALAKALPASAPPPVTGPPAAEDAALTGDWGGFVGPSERAAALPAGESAGSMISVSTVRQLEKAIDAATPGTVIELEPGDYMFHGYNIPVTRAGAPGMPITVRAGRLGAVRLHFDLVEGFLVAAPYWSFQNLDIDGVCSSDSRCEHAFHVVGPARHVVIQNSRVRNFNAPVKINGVRGDYPDDGSLLHNAFYNDGPRRTSNPVTLIDAVAVNGWRVAGNIIADFAKGRGNHVSYAAFFKGNGTGNVFDGNLVRCQWHHRGGTRVGLSFGGGGTGKSSCRDGVCPLEHRGGVMRNNIIIDCSDVGIYLNKSADTLIANNALIATHGIDVRYKQSDARIINNVIDGRILERAGGKASAEANLVSTVSAVLLKRVSDGLYADALEGDFRLKAPKAIMGRGTQVGPGVADICGEPLNAERPDIGPFQYTAQMRCTPALPH